MEERDLWWEARQKTAQMGQPRINLVRTFAQSLPGRATKISFAAASLGREKCSLTVDLNKYRPGRDLKKFVDAGVDAFVLRMGGPTRWVEGDYAYQEDATWRPYMEQCDKLGMLNRTVGYWIENPFEDYHLQGVVSNVHVGLVNQWTSGGFMPASFVSDWEVAEVYRGANKITCTSVNLVRSPESTTDQIWKTFHRPVSIYTANWFYTKFAQKETPIYFDNVNKPVDKGGPGKQRGLWMAWLPQQFTKEYERLEDTLAELITPTGEQTAKYLNIGSNTRADLWQYSFTLKLPGDSTGVDASVSVGTQDEFFTQWGLKATSTPPEKPPEQPPVEEFVTREEFEEFKTLYQGHAHEIGQPM